MTPVFTGRAHRRHCRAILFPSTASSWMLAVHTARVHRPCWRAVFTGTVDRCPWTRPEVTAVRDDTCVTVGHPWSRPM